TEVDFTLARRRYFVVMTFDSDAALAQRQRDLRAQIGERISRRHRHVAFFRTNAIAVVRSGKLVCVAAAVPVRFVGVDRVTGGMLLGVKLDAVEYEKLS